MTRSSDLTPLVRRIHAAPWRFVLAITGGGSRAIADLLEEPGGSRTLLEATVPYSAAALARWLAARPEHFCEPDTARAMSVAGFVRAIDLAEAAAEQCETLAGVACTASLASDRPKRGPHRIHVAGQTSWRTLCCSLVLNKGARSRQEEEQIAARLTLNMLAETIGLAERLQLDLLPGELVEFQRAEGRPEWRGLLLRQADVVQPVATADRRDRLLFPGAFNPLHAGHRRMAELAAGRLGRPVEFELSVENADKPPLDYLELERRLGQFGPDELLWLTRAATFSRKAALFPGATFIVGVDTIRRIADPRFYGAAAAMEAAFEQLAAARCRFIVFGRAIDGRFLSLGDLSLPESLRGLCDAVPGEEFRDDSSSTELRRGRASES